jgi:deoxyribodipyrimidine photolyase-related protein
MTDVAVHRVATFQTLVQLPMSTRNLIIICGDQLSASISALDGVDPQCDRIWMAENDREATHVWCHKYRLVGFFAPMRHFRDALKKQYDNIEYHELVADRRKARGSSFGSLLAESIKRDRPERVIMTQPGDHRVQTEFVETCESLNIELDIRADRDFFCTPERFAAWATSRKTMVLENFYHVMRSEHDVMMQAPDKPAGGQWNFDHENRKKFPKSGPGDVPSPPKFEPDAITQEVIEMVNHRFADHPGSTDHFDLPVTRAQALTLLDDFIENRLPRFGDYQDAMWAGSDFLYHSRLSHAMNLHLLSAQEVVQAATASWAAGHSPIAATEGFVRQVLGWREYVRGIYWLKMPEYATLNDMQCDPDQDVPSFFWDGKTDMACVADSMRLLIKTAYAHHIQRLMVLGLYAQLLGVHPESFHRWHMAMYADAIDWVSLPNALGMSQHGDGGIMATKPYCASGNYINGMSNYCGKCRYNPKLAVGENACPFTTLYWDFLDRHRKRFQSNHRMTMQLKNLERKTSDEMQKIREHATELRNGKTV